MQDSDDLPVEVPEADAVEQRIPADDSVPEEDFPDELANEVPLEAAPADWQEQHETVGLDPELEEPDTPVPLEAAAADWQEQHQGLDFNPELDVGDTD